MLFSVSYQDRKNGESAYRVFEKSFARYRKHGWIGMEERLKKEYFRPDFPYLNRIDEKIGNIAEMNNQIALESILEDFQDKQLMTNTQSISISKEELQEEFLAYLEKLNGFSITLSMLKKYLDGEHNYPIRLLEDDSEQETEIALDIAKRKIIEGDRIAGKRYLQFANSFKPTAEAYELLGNEYLDNNQNAGAVEAYLKASNLIGASEWLEPNFNKVLNNFWNEQKAILTNILEADENREKYALNISALVKEIYNKYFDFYAYQSQPVTKKLSSEKVLIIGDYHVGQCIRYRIAQKVEQLEQQGYEVITQNWTELSQKPEQIAHADIVIFYRTPAVPEVVKAIAKSHVFGKVTFFEIDDMLFDTEYPAPLESYGGNVSFDGYQSLIESMALNRATATLCEYGIASTKSLQVELEKLVKTGQCLLHRNGLDSENIALTKRKIFSSKTVNIFYGSGTLAHNSDFIVEALPAVTRIMEKYDHVNLMVVGHLTLPSELTERFPNRIKTYPKTKTIKAYWKYLNQATINIATLHDDKLNGAKSELKWFEAAYLNVPSVVSATDNYRDVIRNGENGFMVSNDKEWFEALEKLVINQKLREKIATQARKEVVENYSIKALGVSLSKDLQQVIEARNEKVPAKKKMALVNVYFPPQTIGGATRVVSDNFDLLKEKYGDEYDIVVFTTESDCVEPYQVSLYNHQGSTVYKSSILWRENMDWHPKDENMYNVFKEFLAQEQPEFVHFHCVQRMTASVVEATLDAHIPYFVTVHDAWWISDYQFLVDSKGKVFPEGHLDNKEKLILPNNVTKAESRERSVYLKHLLNSAEKSLVVSDSFAKIYAKNGIDNTVVTRNGLSTSINWQPKQTDYTDKVVCALIGGMSAHKGYKLLQDTIVQYQPENIELLIVDLSKPPEYQAKGDWDGVLVRFVGKQTPKTIVSLYQQIDVLLAPSIWPESYGLVSREAAACGCWVVASSLGGMGEDVIEGKSGFVINPTIKELEHVLKVINNEPKKFKGMAETGELRYVTQQVNELVKVYRGI